MKTIEEVKAALEGVCVSPSLLSCDFSRWAQELAAAEKAGARLIHWDIMDGHFVPNLTFGHPVIAKLRPHSELIFDVHLMIDDPVTYAPLMRKAGADIITMHLECPAFAGRPAAVRQTLSALREQGCAAGLAIKPATPVSEAFPFLDLCDMVTVMTVEPGFGGQAFLPGSMPKVMELRSEIRRRGLGCAIEVDGGVNGDTKFRCFEAGANVFVSGSYLFGHEDMAERIAGFYRMGR